MVFRLILFAVLMVSLSGCASKHIVVSSPIPVDSIYKPSEPSPPPPPEPAPVQLPESHPPAEIDSPIAEKVAESISDVDRELAKNDIRIQIGREDKTHIGRKPQPKLTPAASGLITGSAAYQIPSEMIENESSPVDLWIDASLPVKDLSAQLERFLIDNVNRAIKRSGKLAVKSKLVDTTQVVGKEVLIGKKMYAELTGPDFEIQPAGSQAQTYIEGRGFRWSWLVKPKHESKNGIPLEIRVMADPGEGQTPVETIREVVIVHARTKTWREIIEELDWWIKLLGGGGISAIVLWLFKWLFARRKKTGETSGT